MSKNTIIVTDVISLPLPRDSVWQKLNDPQILAKCIRGCSSVERIDNHFKAVITAKVSDYKKEFKVDLTVADDKAPENYQLSSDLNAGLFGKASASADVALTYEGDKNNHTQLKYTATITASGVIAKAMPLVSNLAERRIKEFFDLFQQAATS